jgi:hypothetical protein
MNREQINQYFVSNYPPIDQENIAGFVDFVRAAYNQYHQNQLFYVEGINYLLTKMRDDISDEFLQLLIITIREFAYELSHSPNVTADNLTTVMNNFYEFVNAMIRNTDINRRIITEAIRGNLWSVVQVFQEGINGQRISQDQNDRIQQLNTLINGPTFSPGEVADAVINIAEQARQQGTNGPIYQRALCDFIRGFNNSMEAQPLNFDEESDDDDDERSQQREDQLIENLRQFFTTTTKRISREIDVGVLPITDVNFSCIITMQGAIGQNITSPLESAISTGNLRVVKTLFRECQEDGHTRVNPNFRSVLRRPSLMEEDNQSPTYGKYPLTIAIRNKSWEIVMFLLENGAFAGEEALKAIMNNRNGIIPKDVWDLFKPYYGANRVQEDHELIDQVVQQQNIPADNSLLEMITQLDPSVFVDIPRITDNLGLLKACKKIWTRGSEIFNNWDNYNLYKLLVTYYYAMTLPPNEQGAYPMLNTSSYDPRSFLDHSISPKFEIKRVRSDLDESLSSSSSEQQVLRETRALPEGWSSAVDPTKESTYYFNRTTGVTQWEFPSFSSPPELSYNSENTKKSRAYDGPGGPPAEQLQKPLPPDFEDPDACAQYLGFHEGFESINNRQEFGEKVRRLLLDAGGDEEWKDDIRNARDKILTEKGDNFEGGKRRTMKVKKHFRKTKKRFVKRVKKTRVRRNNKSKRAFKGKKG